MSHDDLKKRLTERLEPGELKIVGSRGTVGSGYREAVARARALPPGGQLMRKAGGPPAPPRPNLIEITESAASWAHSSTTSSLDRAADICKDKMRVIREFFAFIDKDLLDVRPPDVLAWQTYLSKDRGLKPSTVYNWCAHLSSYFKWVIAQPAFAPFLAAGNPVSPVFPKLQPYESDGTQALTRDEFRRLWTVMENDISKTTMIWQHSKRFRTASAGRSENLKCCQTRQYGKSMENMALSISRQEFFNILEECEKYTLIYFNKLAQTMPVCFDVENYMQHEYTAPLVTKINLTELGEFVWRSMKSNSRKTNEIHDEIYVQDQADYFAEIFSSIDDIAWRIEQNADDPHNPPVETPAELFVKLGKAAQLKLIGEGGLETASENYQKAEHLAADRQREESIRRREWFEKNNINLKLKKEVRAADREECVFCGRAYHYHSFSYLKTNDEIPQLDNVLLACNGCLSKRHKTALKPVNGRFGLK